MLVAAILHVIIRPRRMVRDYGFVYSWRRLSMVSLLNERIERQGNDHAIALHPIALMRYHGRGIWDGRRVSMADGVNLANLLAWEDRVDRIGDNISIR